MIRFLPLLTASVLALSLPGFAPLPVQAQQNLFAPRLVINDYAVTEFEYQQRLLFLQLLRAPGDLEKVALDGLVEDRLRMMEAKKFKIALKEADLRKGMEEFASRANLSADDFIKALGQAGVEAETFRDFVAAGLVWREIARGKFTAYAKVSEEDVDRALEAETRKTALTVAVSELIIPAPPGEEARVMDLARRLSREVRGEGAFSAAVARYSAAASRGRGGRLDPMPMTNLPPQISAVVLPLAPGQVSAPVPIPGGVALFQLRSITEGRAEDAAPVEVEYARLRLPADAAGSALMAKVRAQVQTCKDLYGLAPGLPPEQLSITTQTMGAVAQDIGLELARLDPGETVLRAGGQELLMLCARRPAPPPAEAAAPAEGEAPAAPPVIDREAVRTRLINAKIERMANQYLAKLKAEAIIREP
ncbi:peptidylprolyl isomerase [Gemmobacter caeruleus]|uniref:peptidylprolyl isomerase n=1 Tax=Gemmobacter caeruleus TaxID=2595004 RepID=UPI0011EE961D|nr:peptidylprolyl isomerase [Gemmobacter caeruleus]